MLKRKNQPLPPVRLSTPKRDAAFVGWQKTGSGDVFALYNITAADHPSHGSTVTEQSLLKLNLEIPLTPLRPVKMR
jgi:hypothetical protein